MKLEVVRLIKAGLADATYGINAKIAALTLDGTDTRPTVPNRYYDVDHKWLARRQVNDDDTDTITFPALAVFQFAPLEVLTPEVMTVVRDAEIQIAFAYLVKKQDSAAAVRDALYFNRALLRWFNWFMHNDQTSAFRTKNGVIIRSVENLQQDDVLEEWGSADCVASTIATFRVRETSP
jgi:hypothetical protein